MTNETKPTSLAPARSAIRPQTVCDRCGRTWIWEHEAAVHPSVAVVHQTFCEVCSPDNPNAPMRWCVGHTGQRITSVQWDSPNAEISERRE